MYKRYKCSSKKTSKKVRGTRRSKSWKPSLSRVVDGNTPISIRRAYYDATVYFDDTASLRIDTFAGTPCSGYAPGTPTNDTFNTKQFGVAVSFSIDDLIKPGAIRDVWSQYKYGPTEYTLTLESGDSAQSINGGNPPDQAPGCPTVYWYFDPVGDIPPIDAAAALERSNMHSQLLTNNNPIKIKHTLKAALASVGSVNNLYVAQFDTKDTPWMTTVVGNDQDENTISFAGTKFFFRNFGSSYTRCRVRIVAVQNLLVRYMR